MGSEMCIRDSLNTDSLEYDGTGEFGNLGQIVAAPLPAPDRFRAVAAVCVPPMGSVWLRHNPSATAALPGDPGVQ